MIQKAVEKYDSDRYVKVSCQDHLFSMVLLSKNATLCVKYLEECWFIKRRVRINHLPKKVLWPMLRGGRLSFEEIYNNLFRNMALFYRTVEFKML
jgi:hypothetical protein